MLSSPMFCNCNTWTTHQVGLYSSIRADVPTYDRGVIVVTHRVNDGSGGMPVVVVNIMTYTGVQYYIAMIKGLKTAC